MKSKFIVLILLVSVLVLTSGCVSQIDNDVGRNQELTKIGDLPLNNDNQTLKFVGFVKPGIVINCDSDKFYLEDDTGRIQIRFENLEDYVEKRVEIVGKYFTNPSTAICAFDYIIVDTIKILE